MLISFFSFSFRFFLVFLLERCQEFKFFLRSRQLASSVVCRATALVIELPNRIVYDGCTGARQCVEMGKMLK